MEKFNYSIISFRLFGPTHDAARFKKLLQRRSTALSDPVLQHNNAIEDAALPGQLIRKKRAFSGPEIVRRVLIPSARWRTVLMQNVLHASKPANAQRKMPASKQISTARASTSKEPVVYVAIDESVSNNSATLPHRFIRKKIKQSRFTKFENATSKAAANLTAVLSRAKRRSGGWAWQPYRYRPPCLVLEEWLSDPHVPIADSKEELFFFEGKKQVITEKRGSLLRQ